MKKAHNVPQQLARAKGTEAVDYANLYDVIKPSLSKQNSAYRMASCFCN